MGPHPANSFCIAEKTQQSEDANESLSETINKV